MTLIPSCPITGLPASRRVQPISSTLISELWRWSFGTRVEPQLAEVGQFGLWESPCGLAFFEPMLAGNEGFYQDLYRRAGFHRALSVPRIPRAEFERIAELVRPGDKVLDVGCGEAALAPYLTHATYVGLEPHPYSAAGEPDIRPDIRNETIAEHAASHSEEYDIVCALHAIEHVADPLGFARDLVKCLRAGGHLVIAVPSRESALTQIPNFVLNAPPHHLSWWNEPALQALADRLGVILVAIEALPFSFDSMIYWMGRFSPKLVGDRYFRAHWIWHGALAWSWLAARICNALFPIPASARPSGLLLVARKPS